MVTAQRARDKTFESAINKAKTQAYEYSLSKLIDSAIEAGQFTTHTAYTLEDDKLVRRILDFYGYAYRTIYYDNTVEVIIEW